MAHPSRLAIVIAAVALLSACTTWNPETQPKQSVGTVLGAIGGGVLGSQIGGGRGKLAATAAGTLLGAWVGSEVGASLDRADRLYLQQATYSALENNPTGTASTWNNLDSGHYGSVTPLRTYKTASEDCREYEQHIVMDGRDEIGYGTACRQPDGRWKII
ncbi:MAG: RT0821/Lpp0805 family surface protein [Alphaproteobacteria bacterium]|nr:RT0821/Lpp0805 family surface protein [Alphaproteobacteria bacterium]